MADKRITEYPNNNAPLSTDVYVVVNGGVTKKITIGEIMRSMPAGSVASPGIRFGTGTESGFYYDSGGDKVHVVINGVSVGSFEAGLFRLSKLVIDDSITIPPLNITERSIEPTAPVAGDIYLDDGTNTQSTKPGFRRYTGTVWEDVSPSGVVAEQQVVYIGKHGNDANDGNTIAEAKLTFGAAFTAASALTPASANIISLVSLDGGTYTENLTGLPWVNIDAPATTIIGNHTVVDDMHWTLHRLEASSGMMVTKSTGTDSAFIEATEIILTGSANGGSSNSGVLYMRGIHVTMGTGVGAGTTGTGKIHFNYIQIKIVGAGTALSMNSTGTISADIQVIEDDGSGTGIVVSAGGTVRATINNLGTNTAYNVSAGVLDLIVTDVSGTKTWTGGVVKIGGAGAENVSLASATGVSHTLQDMQDLGHSAGIVNAVDINNILTASGTAGSIDFTAHTAYFRVAATSTSMITIHDIVTGTVAIPIDTSQYIHCDYNSGSPQVITSLTDDANGFNIFTLGYAVNIGGVIVEVFNIPDRFNDHARVMNERFWDIEGVRRVSGAIISEDVTAFKFDITSAKWWAKNTEYTTTAFDGATDTYGFYSTADSGTSWTESLTTLALSNTQYNDVTLGLVTLSNNKWSFYDFYISVADSDVKVLPSQAQYATQAEAEAGAATSVGLPDEIDPVVYQFIGRGVFQKSAANFAVFLSAFATTLQASPVVNHDDTGSRNLDANHLQYSLIDGARAFTGVVTMAAGTNIASATTVDLTAATGNLIHITGTVATTAFTMNSGQKMDLIADGVWPLTYNATTMKLNGGVSYTTSAGDRLHVEYDGTTAIVNIVREDGKAIVGGSSEDYILIQDQKTSGISGGTFSSGAWRTRDLNAIVNDAGGHASVASNQVTLAAGTYRFKGFGVVNAVNTHKIKLRNVTASTDVEIGTAENASGATSKSFVTGRFTIASATVFELQHLCETTKTTSGFGLTFSIGSIELYAQIEFWKEL